MGLGGAFGQEHSDIRGGVSTQLGRMPARACQFSAFTASRGRPTVFYQASLWEKKYSTVDFFYDCEPPGGYWKLNLDPLKDHKTS